MWLQWDLKLEPLDLFTTTQPLIQTSQTLGLCCEILPEVTMES